MRVKLVIDYDDGTEEELTTTDGVLWTSNLGNFVQVRDLADYLDGKEFHSEITQGMQDAEATRVRESLAYNDTDKE
jgi:hypothetical protein